MRPATATLKEALALPHNPVALVEVLHNGTVINTITTVTDGTVTLDAAASVRGRMDLTIIDDGSHGLIPTAVDDPLAPYGNEVKVYRGVRFPRGLIELVPLIVARIDTPRVSEEGGMPTITISGQDRSARIIDARFEEPYEVAAGTNLITAITDVIEAVYPDVVTDFIQTAATTGTVIAEAQADRWEFAGKLALAAGMRLYFDGDGVLRLAPEVTTGPAVADLVEGDGGVLVSAAREWTREAVRNVIVATGENTGDASASVRGVAEDLDPDSPTYVHGPFGRVVGFFSSPILTTNDQCVQAAQTILARSTGTTQRLDLGSLVLPYLEPGDVVNVARQRIGIVNERHILDSVTVPLAIGGTMSSRTRAITITGAQ